MISIENISNFIQYIKYFHKFILEFTNIIVYIFSQNTDPIVYEYFRLDFVIIKKIARIIEIDIIISFVFYNPKLIFLIGNRK